MNWKNVKTLVTGGASFIGSHLVDALRKKGAIVRVVDNLSSGSTTNLKAHLWKGEGFEFIHAGLCDTEVARKVVRDMQYVFHLAADHGGRGYIERHEAGPATNLLLDSTLFLEAMRAEVRKVIYASSLCVYPKYLWNPPDREVRLKEDMVGPPFEPDNVYGLVKLMGEKTLQAYHKEHGLKCVSLRYTTTYGPRARESISIMGLIAKAFIGQNPIEVWGNGTQTRDWTYVDDIVRGTILAAEKVSDGSVVNLGSGERITITDAVKMIQGFMNKEAEITFKPGMPTGPIKRLTDFSLAKELLNWEPQTTFKEGLKRTIDWYVKTKDVTAVSKNLSRILMEKR